ncbi:hypothetical protein E2C01_069492 [Portunus trituberculatus]|uniref:Uncharacterized protein n=1 Tax=Portunus trituberculatus TaxID=210409 RepID=A0A5B7I0Y0_PORTR|nr:hypothetical protein [Portunus trituberculatus]
MQSQGDGEDDKTQTPLLCLIPSEFIRTLLEWTICSYVFAGWFRLSLAACGRRGPVNPLSATKASLQA